MGSWEARARARPSPASATSPGGARRTSSRSAAPRRAARRGATRLERTLDEVARLLPGETTWLAQRFERLREKGPFKLLIQIVLSHQTTIRIEDLAIERLWTRFQTPQQFARAKVEDVDALIGNVNLHSMKARRIIAIARSIIEKWDGSLEFLRRLPLRRALEELTALPGVGRKTAAIVLLAVFRRPILPVDTNILRAARALGLAGEADTPDAVSEKLEALLPRDPRVLARAHTHLLALGRAIRWPANRWMVERLRSMRSPVRRRAGPPPSRRRAGQGTRSSIRTAPSRRGGAGSARPTPAR